MTTVDVLEVELQVLNTKVSQAHDTDSKLTVMSDFSPSPIHVLCHVTACFYFDFLILHEEYLDKH